MLNHPIKPERAAAIAALSERQQLDQFFLFTLAGVFVASWRPLDLATAQARRERLEVYTKSGMRLYDPRID